jgi:hypothetical protein
MDRLQKQITDLNRKVDQLYGIIEQLSLQVNDLVSEKQPQIEKEDEFVVSFDPMTSPLPLGESDELIMGHKDILLDPISPSHRTPPTYAEALSVDLQVRRLTAQLTAAYNRIAILEEQLIACRMHS